MSSGAVGGLKGEGGHHAVAEPSMPGQPKTIVLAIDSLQPDDVPGLMERASMFVAPDGTTVLLCDVARLADVDMATIDALARIALRARRLGCAVNLRDAPPELLQLLAFAGLSDVLPCDPSSGVKVTGQPEQREEPLGVQEERDPADPPVA
jgi:ABC-type transporter Mla MlaB component